MTACRPCRRTVNMAYNKLADGNMPVDNLINIFHNRPAIRDFKLYLQKSLENKFIFLLFTITTAREYSNTMKCNKLSKYIVLTSR